VSQVHFAFSPSIRSMRPNNALLTDAYLQRCAPPSARHNANVRRHQMGAHKPHVAPVIVALLLVYGAASLIHFAHNAEYLADYPNMPTWLSRSAIYGAWIAVTALGIGGYLLLRRGYGTLGLCVIAAYAALGFDGLTHFILAPFERHSVAMHLTIWFEVAAAGLLLATVACFLAKLMWPKTNRRGV
jgi:hypothetical protein